MTEPEWMACGDPIDMLLTTPGQDASDRKVRRFLVACCRRVWDAMAPADRATVGVAERCADGTATADELRAAERQARLYRDVGSDQVQPEDRPESYWCAVAAWMVTNDDAHFAAPDVCDAVLRVVEGRGGDGETAAQARLLRCVLGNPFRPVAFDPAWRTGAVIAVAGAIDRERAFERLPELAEALRLGGCGDAGLLSHCRDAGPHARGCFVVDAVLGREQTSQSADSEDGR